MCEPCASYMKTNELFKLISLALFSSAKQLIQTLLASFFYFLRTLQRKNDKYNEVDDPWNCKPNNIVLSDCHTQH